VAGPNWSYGSRVVFAIYYVLFFFWLALVARLVVEVVKGFARQWRGPTSAIAVVSLEIAYRVTDPPVRQSIPEGPTGIWENPVEGWAARTLGWAKTHLWTVARARLVGQLLARPL
jgi:hypothetical protein